MIALFAPSLARAERMARRMHTTSPEIDGPFRLFKGKLGHAEARIFAVEHGADAAWAAARLAARRGVRYMVPVVECIMLGEAANDPWFEAPPGTCLPVRKCWDLAGLAPLLRLLPESAAELPRDPAPLMPAAPVMVLPREGPVVGTLPWACRSRELMRWLLKHHKIGATDLQLAGYAAATADEADPPGIAPVAAVVERITRRGVERATALQVETAMDAALDEMLEQMAESLT